MWPIVWEYSTRFLLHFHSFISGAAVCGADSQCLIWIFCFQPVKSRRSFVSVGRQYHSECFREATHWIVFKVNVIAASDHIGCRKLIVCFPLTLDLVAEWMGDWVIEWVSEWVTDWLTDLTNSTEQSPSQEANGCSASQ